MQAVCCLGEYQFTKDTQGFSQKKGYIKLHLTKPLYMLHFEFNRL